MFSVLRAAPTGAWDLLASVFINVSCLRHSPLASATAKHRRWKSSGFPSWCAWNAGTGSRCGI